MTLEEAITQLINLGEKDPLTIVEKLAKRHGDEWLREEAALHAHDFSADLARRLLGARRRGSEIALKPGDQVASSELKLRSYWVPEYGYKRASDLTADDLLVRVRFYNLLERSAAVKAAWLLEVVDLMVAEGAKTLGKLKAALPPLPSGEPPLELGAV